MPFIVIQGTFRVVGKTKAGKASGFEPDGDSMQFKPDKRSLLDRLTRLSQPYRLTAIGSTQLRFEGVDALELHFTVKGAGVLHQPRPLADEARNFLVTQCGLDPVQYQAPKKLRVQPPAVHDGQAGYILARSLEVHGRPVAFVFAEAATERDGAEIRLEASRLTHSLNYALLDSGNAYPLFYDTLFHDLRAALAQAADRARQAGTGVWASDRTHTGLTSVTFEGLQSSGVVFPKLFRRLAEYRGAGHTGLGKFRDWLAARGERVFDLDTTNNTHFDTYVSVSAGEVTMTKAPDRLVFISAKRKEAWV